MGRNFATDLAEFVDIETAVHIHLTSNHFPPVPTSMVSPCLEAIALANDGDYDELVELPDGITWRGAASAPAWALIDGHHLEPFINTVA